MQPNHAPTFTLYSLKEVFGSLVYDKTVLLKYANTTDVALMSATHDATSSHPGNSPFLHERTQDASHYAFPMMGRCQIVLENEVISGIIQAVDDAITANRPYNALISNLFLIVLLRESFTLHFIHDVPIPPP